MPITNSKGGTVATSDISSALVLVKNGSAVEVHVSYNGGGRTEELFIPPAGLPVTGLLNALREKIADALSLPEA